MDHGKSTLIKIILGKDSKYQGEIKLSPSVKIGYIPQEIKFENEIVGCCLEKYQKIMFGKGEAKWGSQRRNISLKQLRIRNF